MMPFSWGRCGQDVRRFLSDETGATAVEYALIVALIASVCITTIGLMGGGLGGLFDSTAQQVNAAMLGAKDS